MIVITGATGALNGATTDRLLERVPAGDVAVAVRDPGRAERFRRLGVAVRRCDYADPASLPQAFDGADQLLLVSSNEPDADRHQALHAAAIDAAVAVGVGRILYTSHQGASPDTPFGPGRTHAATEVLLERSGVPWTSLRNGFYAHSLTWLMGPWPRTGVVSVPADGPVSWTAREDAAEGAAVILAAGAGYDGPVTITAGAAPTFADLARIASGLSGRPIDFEVVDPEVWLRAQEAAGQQRAGFLLGMYEAARDGFFAGTDPLLHSLLGREPRTAEDAVATALAG